ncbi:MAG: cytochrome-c peroxidase [Thiohalomonadales bacterium]
MEQKYKKLLMLLNGLLMLSLATMVHANPEKIQLGKLLYNDTDLSLNKNQACASCHAPTGFADPRNAADPAKNVVSLGSDITLNGGRNAPSSAYAAFTPIFHWNPMKGMYMGGQFWDGRSATLTDQAQGPFLNPVEMAMPSKKAVLMAIANETNANYSEYATLFQNVYGVTLADLITTENQTYIDAVYVEVADAIAAFEKSPELNKFNSKYDYFLKGDVQLTESEANGLALFNGKANCSQCHKSMPLTAPDGSKMPPLFADFMYDNLGIPKSSNPKIANDPIDNGLGGRADIAANDPEGNQLGKHKVVTLRNVELTAPYGHNGFFATLKEIVHFYNTRDVAEWPQPEVSQNLNTTQLGDLGLTDAEENDIVAFMKTLTDTDREPLNNFPFPPFP